MVLVILLIAALWANSFPDKKPSFIITAISLGVAANVVTVSLSWLNDRFSGWFLTSNQYSKSILESIISEIKFIEDSQHDIGRYEYSYEHAIFSPNIMKRVDYYIKRFSKKVKRLEVDEITSAEASLLTLFAGYNKSVINTLESKFVNTSLPEFTRLAEKAGSNKSFQKIVLTLALGRYFPGEASSIVDQIFSSDHRIHLGDWISHSRINFEKAILYANKDEVLITYHIGNSYKPFDIFSKLTNRMERIDFYLIHPCILSRQGLKELASELDASNILKKEVNFLSTKSGDFKIDYIRKIFQLLSNIHEISEYNKQRNEQKIRLFFYTKEIPSVCVQIVKNFGYLFLIPAAFDNAKFLSRFSIEVKDQRLCETFASIVDRDLSIKQNYLANTVKNASRNMNSERYGGEIEEFKFSEKEFKNLYSESLYELAVYLQSNNISKQDLVEIESELLIRLPSDIAFIKECYKILLNYMIELENE